MHTQCRCYAAHGTAYGCFPLHGKERRGPSPSASGGISGIFEAQESVYSTGEACASVSESEGANGGCCDRWGKEKDRA